MVTRGSQNAARTTASLALGLLALSALAGFSVARRRDQALPNEPLSPEPQASPPLEAYQRVAVAYVTQHETGTNNPAPFETVNANTDGAGLSYGIIQWNQQKGGLGKLLSMMQTADPDAFARIFGIPWRELLQATNASTEAARMAPVGGVELWREPWLSRFRLAGQHGPFIQAQWNMALTDVHMTSAMEAARLLGLNTLRGITLLYDRAVQQGPYGTLDKARALAQSYAILGVRPTYQQVLTDFQRATLAPFVDVVQRGSSWRQVGNVWHRFRGSIDLHDDTLKRTSNVLASTYLSDEPISNFPA